MRKPGATSFGHINRAMTSTMEAPIYASADGYETPIHLKTTTRKMKSAMKHQERAISCWQFDETDRGPPPPRGMYRNIAYF
ncbi:hypothetical protein OSTOST_15760 [Ostertagia ostertagi]